MLHSIVFIKPQLPPLGTTTPPPPPPPRAAAVVPPSGTAPEPASSEPPNTSPSTAVKHQVQPSAAAMLSRSRCVYRTLGRSLSAANNVLVRQSVSGLSVCSRLVYRNSQPCEFPSSANVFHIRYFKTSAVHRDEVVTVKTPAFAESVTEGDVRWEKAVGDSVTEDEVVCEIETDKTSVQVPAPAAGVIEELLVPDGGKVGGADLQTPERSYRRQLLLSIAEAPAAAAVPSSSTSSSCSPTAMPTVPQCHIVLL
ncbi:dihydrolipoyllysine-residue succinyltransferase component of 2-oxoglutarate dehydrogenase complex, mitochondrial-like isoform X2 [Lates japonicus]|uniref:Dihydrolipoyllysine-residue succinyltransferase component of 2-oxoglutarate dehydrogenase complex, mitochondrial-like isoform X2 n=1 Tax=Lates japonicus TaxID=270547 RepID=A0AAD3R7A9_LATJO|nr:dihydrolipoyllysine-residue succinyltransferase component of 2-oxoglutarate dehydrogenase complex, mitochondrial-like isoform X2 [Lates japonicus]